MLFAERCGKPPFSIASKPYIDEASSEAAFVCAIICSIFGVIGNVSTIVVLFWDKALRRHSTTPFLLSLAFSDLIFSSFNLPLLAVRFYHRDWILGYNTCELFPFFFYGNIMISALSMALIALNRFVGIYYAHLMPKLFSLKKSWTMVVATWTFSLGLMAIPLTEIWGQMGFEPTTFSCTVLPKDDKSPMTFLIVLGIVTPCVIMMICYGMILYRVRKTGRNMRDVVPEDEAEPALTRERSIKHLTLKRERQLTKTLLMICTGFIVCFMPTSLIMIFDPMPPCYKNPKLHVAGYIIFWCSAIINPIIYTLSNRTYRSAMRKFFTLYCKCGGPEDDVASTTWYDKDITSPAETFVLNSSTRSTKSSARSSKHSRKSDQVL